MWRHCSSLSESAISTVEGRKAKGKRRCDTESHDPEVQPLTTTRALGTRGDYPRIVYIVYISLLYSMIDFADEARRGSGAETQDGGLDKADTKGTR